MNESIDRPIRPLRRAIRYLFYATSVIVLTAVVPLFIFSNQTDRGFSWTIKPGLTAAFLGAGYLAAFPLEFLSSKERVWSRARLGITAVLLFTLLTLVATLLHLDGFHFHDTGLARFSAWAWLALYVFVPPIMGGLLVLQIRVPGGDGPISIPMPGWAKALLVVQAAAFIPAGVLLFVAPNASSWWPWTLTPLTSQAVGAWVLSIGFVAARAAGEGDVDRPPAIAALVVLGVAELAALARFRSDVDWSRPGAWIYLAFLASLVVTGALAIMLILRGRGKASGRRG